MTGCLKTLASWVPENNPLGPRIAKLFRILTCQKEKTSIPLYDGLILKLHYIVTFLFMAVSFLAVSQHWFHDTEMICTRQSMVNSNVKKQHLDICRSYSYIEDEGAPDGKRYISYYRWIPWVFISLTVVYFIPRLASKKFDITKQLKDVLTDARKDSFNDPEKLRKAGVYMEENRGTHNGIYWKYLFLNIFALGVDVLSVFLWDILLKGSFLTYGMNLKDWYNRKHADFSDEISKTFPPFVKCTIGRNTVLTSTDTFEYGCHFTFMELYEKVFFMLWFWLFILILITALYIIFLICMGPYTKFLMCFSCAEEGVTTVGDYYLLFRLRSHISDSKCKYIFGYQNNANNGSYSHFQGIPGTSQVNGMNRNNIELDGTICTPGVIENNRRLTVHHGSAGAKENGMNRIRFETAFTAEGNENNRSLTVYQRTENQKNGYENVSYCSAV